MRPFPLFITVAGIAASVWAVFLSDRPFYTEGPEDHVKTCKEDWHLCKDNTDLMENWSGRYKVQTACEAKGKSLALYGQSHWGSDGWLSGFPFASYMSGDDAPKKGLLDITEKNVQLQNQYGTMVHRQATCVFNLNKMKIVSLFIEPVENAPGGTWGQDLINGYEDASARLYVP